MNQENEEKQELSWEEAHPWLSTTLREADDSVEEVIRYTLDELRLA